MLQYPSINSWRKSPIGKPCVAFVKYDGSNLRWEWSPKRGWYKFGTRRQMFDHNTPLYNQAIEIFQDEMGPVIVEQTKYHIQKNVERIIAFTEFFGPSSFSGSHEPDEPKTLKLFDVSTYKKGFIAPKTFVEMFEKFDWAAEEVYRGNMSLEFVRDVKSGKYPVYEGVICKGDGWQAKIKTDEYLARLFRDDLSLWEVEKDE
jgi:hypothetical protein